MILIDIPMSVQSLIDELGGLSPLILIDICSRLFVVCAAAAIFSRTSPSVPSLRATLKASRHVFYRLWRVMILGISVGTVPVGFAAISDLLKILR